MAQMEPLKKKVELFLQLRKKVELCCFLLTRQVYSQKVLLCRSSHEVPTKMAARLLDVRRRVPVAFIFLFTCNVEFLQTFAFKFVFQIWTSILWPNFTCQETLSSRNSLFYANKRELKTIHRAQNSPTVNGKTSF